MTSKDCLYHKSGKKGPTLLVYQKKDEELDDVENEALDSLNLDGNEIKWVKEQKFLGLTVDTRGRDSEGVQEKDSLEEIQEEEELEGEGINMEGVEVTDSEAETGSRQKPKEPDKCISSKRLKLKISTRRIIDRYGYCLRWNVAKIKKLAYRIQQGKDRFLPTQNQAMVQGYVAGSIRFGVALLWLRGDPKLRQEINFYYAMAAAAILQADACEVLGLSACRATAVSDDSAEFHNLLNMTRLTSVRDMAIHGARVIVKQASLLREDMFKWGNVRNRNKNFDPSLPCAISVEYRGTLMEELVELSHLKMKSDKPPVAPSNAAFNFNGNAAELLYKKAPKLREPNRIKEVWELVSEIVKEKSGGEDVGQALELFGALCKHDLNSLDHQERRKRFRTPSRRLINNCKLLPPAHVVSNTEPCCKVCGELTASDSNLISCTTCSCRFHSKCVHMSLKHSMNRGFSDFQKTFSCDSLKFSFKKQSLPKLMNSDYDENELRMMLIPVLRAKRTVYRNDDLECELCGSVIETNEKQHVLSCKGTGTPLAPALKRLKLQQYQPKIKSCKEKFKKLGEKILKINTVNPDYHRGITRQLKRRQLFKPSKSRCRVITGQK